MVKSERSPCSQFVSDARNIAASIEEYSASHYYADIRPSDLEGMTFIDNPWTFKRDGDEFFIFVIDRYGKCPDDFKMKHPDWSSDTYTYRFRLYD